MRRGCEQTKNHYYTEIVSNNNSGQILSFSQYYKMGNKLTVELLGLLMDYFVSEMLDRSKQTTTVPAVRAPLPAEQAILSPPCPSLQPKRGMHQAGSRTNLWCKSPREARCGRAEPGRRRRRRVRSSGPAGGHEVGSARRPVLRVYRRRVFIKDG